MNKCEHGISGEPCPDCIKEYHAEQASASPDCSTADFLEMMPSGEDIYAEIQKGCPARLRTTAENISDVVYAILKLVSRQP